MKKIFSCSTCLSFGSGAEYWGIFKRGTRLYFMGGTPQSPKKMFSIDFRENIDEVLSKIEHTPRTPEYAEGLFYRLRLNGLSEKRWK